MAKAKFDITTTRPFYASVGAADLTVELVREAVADVQKRLTLASADLQARVADVQRTVGDPKGLRKAAVKDAKARQAKLEERVADLREGAQAVPGRVQSLVTELVSENAATVNEAYDDLTRRGQKLVKRIRSQRSTQDAKAAAGTTRAKAKTTRTQVAKTAEATQAEAKAAAAGAKKAAGTARKRATTATRSAKATVTAAQKTAEATTEAVADAAQKIGD